MTFERRQGRHDANHGVLLFTLLDCGLVKYYIVAEGRTYLVIYRIRRTKVHERRTKIDRLTQLREYMEKERLDAFYIAKPANVRCISGFTGEDSFLFITKANQYFITDARYTEQASYECPDYELVNWRIKFWLQHGESCCILRRQRWS